MLIVYSLHEIEIILIVGKYNTFYKPCTSQIFLTNYKHLKLRFSSDSRVKMDFLIKELSLYQFL